MATYVSGRDIVINLNVHVLDQLTQNEIQKSKQHILIFKNWSGLVFGNIGCFALSFDLHCTACHASTICLRRLCLDMLKLQMVGTLSLPSNKHVFSAHISFILSFFSTSNQRNNTWWMYLITVFACAPDCGALIHKRKC